MVESGRIVTFAIPCYNSENYMNKCIKSLLPAGKRVEIIIVDDGSTDSTPAIADAYEVKYPDIIRVIHKENGGHGDAVNAALEEATGIYFKVIDSDDWVDKKALFAVLDKLEELDWTGQYLDVMITNFVYYKDGRRHKKVMRYGRSLPQNRIFTWEDPIHINKFQYILMHSVTYRTDLLLSCGVELPKHMFYVDNIFLFQPLIQVKTMYYMDVNLYQYYIGREGQSVNQEVMIGRIDQQIQINKMLIEIYSGAAITHRSQNHYLLQYFDMMMCVASVMLILGGTPQHLRKKKALWDYLYRHNKKLYWHMRLSLFGIVMNLPGRFGRFLSKVGYRINQKLFGFN